MLVKMTCPQCGANLEVDSSKETFFCEFCGTKIANVAEKIDVNVSGKVEIDETGKLGNFAYMVENAVKAGNYQEAYNYCLRILETNPRHLTANLYKGLSAAMLSTPGNVRFQEGVVSLDNAVASGQMTYENSQDIKKFTGYVNTMMPATFDAHCTFKQRDPFSNEAAARGVFNMSYGVILFISKVVSSLNDTLLTQVSELEQNKKNMIMLALKMSKTSLTDLKYISGYHTQQKKSGGTISTVTVTDYAKLKNPYAAEIKKNMETLTNQYNTLPSTVKGVSDFDEEITKRKNIINDYDSSLDAFLSTDKELEKMYKHPGLFGRAKKRAAVEEKFSAELLSKKAASELAEDELKQFESQKKKFLKENTI